MKLGEIIWYVFIIGVIGVGGTTSYVIYFDEYISESVYGIIAVPIATVGALIAGIYMLIKRL